MSEELKITQDRIKRLVRGLDGCHDAQQAVKDAFPEAFEEVKKVGGKDITEEITWKVYEFCTGNYWLIGTFKGEEMFYFDSRGFHFNLEKHEEDYEFEIRDRDKAFRIFKKV